MPFLVSFFVYVPDDLVGDRNVAGPLLTDTLCTLFPRNFHVTLAPLSTLTTGTPLGRTK